MLRSRGCRSSRSRRRTASRAGIFSRSTSTMPRTSSAASRRSGSSSTGAAGGSASASASITMTPSSARSSTGRGRRSHERAGGPPRARSPTAPRRGLSRDRGMKALAEWTPPRSLRGVFFDIDDTLTTEGRLTGQAYAALERLHGAGLTVVPITGRPAGWCDHIARMWPVDAVIGENGAFYFGFASGKLEKRFVDDEPTRARHRRELHKLAEAILRQVPGAALASDQPYRETDLAIDYCEDVAPLSTEAVERIVALMRGA